MVNDTNVDAMNVTFRTNASGTWADINTNSSVPNGTYSQTSSNMNSYNTKYWWSVNVTDGTTWTNATYNFTTDYLPTLINENPQNESEGVSLWPACNITVSDYDDETVDVYFYENATTGSWVLQQINLSVSVSSPANVILGNYSNASNPSTKYWWSVNVTDGVGWTNKTYSFTTAASPFFYLYNGNRYRKISDFIPGANKPEKEYVHCLDISARIVTVNQSLRLSITEEMDETTYLDRAYILVDSHKVVELTSLSNVDHSLLEKSDDKYLMIIKGESYQFEVILPERWNKVEFVAEGYYIKNECLD